MRRHALRAAADCHFRRFLSAGFSASYATRQHQINLTQEYLLR